ncbi:hypothetical protein GCM10011351_10290 [Paraliobacillus quinghaiensis]|uniref:DUF2953 domain-containing protein n=1 Tax=Paraliobacillus quinghaiensis TaxID=470815 RepID=A0A917WS12_9BACI|nr:DUF2953 domain-containing protein [Paraliobacillus quinghaiensis]GGM26512.1 hypothetical protein GCM10011351_10290 [Paraliobacillus quinghaiensis]
MLIIILIIVSILLISLFISIKFTVEIKWEQQDLLYLLIIHVAGIPCYKQEEIIEMDMSEEGTEDLVEGSKNIISGFKERFKKYINLYEKRHIIQKLIRRRLRKVKVHTFDWETTIGTADAASTGMISGLCWSIKGSVGAMLDSFMKLKTTPNYQVTPVFQEKLINSTCTCIFSIRLGQAMYTLMQIGKWNRKLLN